MSRRKRPIEQISLSFLDCICCGFGAIILLLVIVKTAEPMIIEESREDLSGILADLQEQLVEIRGETTGSIETCKPAKNSCRKSPNV